MPENLNAHVPAGLVLEPLPVGAWAFMAVTTAIATKTLTFAQVHRAVAAGTSNTHNHGAWLPSRSCMTIPGLVGSRLALPRMHARHPAVSRARYHNQTQK